MMDPWPIWAEQGLLLALVLAAIGTGEAIRQARRRRQTALPKPSDDRLPVAEQPTDHTASVPALPAAVCGAAEADPAAVRDTLRGVLNARVLAGGQHLHAFRAQLDLAAGAPWLHWPDLWERYLLWAEAEALVPLTAQALQRALRDAEIEKTTQHYRNGGKRCRVVAYKIGVAREKRAASANGAHAPTPVN